MLMPVLLFVLFRTHFEIGGHQITDTPQFFYRENGDNTIDSICGLCFLTVATAESKEDLHAREAAHECWKKSLTDYPSASES